MSSSSGRLPAPFARALAARGFTDLTPIQRAVLDAGGDGDLVISAPTGAGKTFAFGMALAPALVGSGSAAPAGRGPVALVVVPTRDLAAQVGNALTGLFSGTEAGVVLCTGGSDRGTERAALAGGAAVVVGSPGRLCDHLASGTLATGRLRWLVLDEADELLEGGFLGEIRRVVAALPAACRVILSSATITARTTHLLVGMRGGRTPQVVTGAGAAPCRGSMQAMAVAPPAARRAVANLLRLHRPERALIFCRRRRAAADLAAWLRGEGFLAVDLTGALPGRERAAALAALRDGAAAVCVATDLAARGLDLVGIGLVIHAGLPHGAEGLIHRNGRAGRNGIPGVAVLVAAPGDRRRAEALARRAALDLDWIRAPDSA
jgi:ATP-dependent RNA helicase DeaD